MPGPLDKPCDVTVIGGGPGGAVAAISCVREGLSVRILERDRFPRFHIGESLLPHTRELLEELGLFHHVECLPHVPKYGAAFVMGDSQTPTRFWFPQQDRERESRTVNIDRAHLDRALLGAAQDEGVEVHQGVRVNAIEHLGAGRVELDTSEGRVVSKMLIDASGQGTFVGRQLGTRSAIDGMDRVAYFEHFRGVDRPEGRASGSSIIVMCEEAWFWIIPLDHERTSVGLVMRNTDAKRTGVPAEEMLRWGAERSPFVQRAMRHAEGPATNRVCADYSYTCAPFAGDGYFLVGDAAMFVDPVFSTGVSLAIESGRLAARGVAAVLRNPATASREHSRYARTFTHSTRPLFRLIEQFYSHPFREILLDGEGPIGIHNAVLSVLSGNVFPRPRFSVRWRMALFNQIVRLHTACGVVAPRREEFSLMRSSPQALSLAPAAPSAVG